MLNVEQLRYGADNFSYLVYGGGKAAAVDGGAGNEILSFLKKNSLELIYVTNTHDHYDHTSGNEILLRSTEAQYLDPSRFADGSAIEIGGENMLVYRTPGHTVDSVCFSAGNFLLSGDTLFNGTIGNCFTGDIRSFYLSVKRLMVLPGETIVYAGHDYVRDALAFAAILEPGNKDIGNFKRNYDFDHVFSTIAEERQINPYMRFNEEPIIRTLKARGLPCQTEWERWQSLMSIE